ncbi:MAG TPA: hypothetical protein VLL48_10220 [Longimicrobiales bacterium]|nr:hypothetical protein [Longimicrobiales bacterium]
MGRKGRGGGGRPRPVKGFRPGKEPPHLKKQRAKARLGSDASWLQKQTVEAIVGRSPREVETMVRNWSVGLLVVAIALAVLGVFLYRWSLVAGLVAHAVTLLPLFLAYRLRKQGPGLVEMAETLR